MRNRLTLAIIRHAFHWAILLGINVGVILIGSFIFVESVIEGSIFSVALSDVLAGVLLGVIYFNLLALPLVTLGLAVFGLPITYFLMPYPSGRRMKWLAALVGWLIGAFVFFAFDALLKAGSLTLSLALAFGFAFGAPTGFFWAYFVRKGLLASVADDVAG